MILVSRGDLARTSTLHSFLSSSRAVADLCVVDGGATSADLTGQIGSLLAVCGTVL